MNPEQLLISEKIRQQFDSSPYPRIPLDQSPKDNACQLYIHNLVTAFYQRDRHIIDTTERWHWFRTVRRRRS